MGTFLRKGTTFVDGTTIVNATNLNAHVDDGIIEPTAISALTNKSVLVGTEEVMINDGGTLKKTSAQSVSEFVAAIPIGTVIDFAGIVSPTGWFMCYGQAISRTTYSELFAAIGATYGSGDGATTFNLPDCRGRVIAGKDDMGGTSADRITAGMRGTAAFNGDALGAAGGNERSQDHVHQYYDQDQYFSIVGASGFAAGPHFNQQYNNASATRNTYGLHSDFARAESGNVQPTIIMHKIIKY